MNPTGEDFRSASGRTRTIAAGAGGVWRVSASGIAAIDIVIAATANSVKSFGEAKVTENWPIASAA